MRTLTFAELDVLCTCGHRRGEHSSINARCLTDGCECGAFGAPIPTLPRPIEPGEIRVGDRVRLTWDEPGSVHTHEFTVTFTDDIDGLRSIGYKLDTGYTTEYVGTWELLSRPTPAPAVGSRWRDDETGAEYVADFDGDYLRYNGVGRAVLYRTKPGDADAIARLTPIPDHGDGCSPWLWDEETDSAWVAANLRGSGRTHAQVLGNCTSDGSLHPGYELDSRIADRLRPYSERGQANG